MNDIINQMKHLGFTEYEVKAYLSLLKNAPQNGYSLSKESGIPRSRIYEVLDSLKAKHIVFEQTGQTSSLYTPINPELLTQKLRQTFNTMINAVGDYTLSLHHSEVNNVEPKILKGHHQIISMLKTLIHQAKHRIALSIWHEELTLIKSDIDMAVSQGVILRGMYFGSLNPYTDLVSHRRIERYIAEKSERFIIVIIDDQHVLSGIISRGDDSTITWSTDPGIIEINDDFIAHDVMLNTYNTSLHKKELTQYERTLDTVRKHYYNFSDEEFQLFPSPTINTH